MRLPETEVQHLKAIYEVHGVMSLREWAERAINLGVWDADQQRQITIDGAMERVRNAIRSLNKRTMVPWVLPVKGVEKGSEVRWKQPSLFSYEEMDQLLTDRLKQVDQDMQELAMLLDLCQKQFDGRAPTLVMTAVSLWRSK